MAAAREDDAASKRKALEEEDSSPETVAVAAAEAEASDDEADPVIRNLNLMSRLNLTTPEWIENMKRHHREHIDLYNRAYDALENGEIESDDEASAAEYEEWSKRLWASVDMSNLIVGDGVDAVPVFPEDEEDEGNHDAASRV